VYCRHNLVDFDKIKSLVEKMRPGRLRYIKAIEDPRKAIRLSRNSGRVVVVSGMHHHKFAAGDWVFGPNLAKLVKRANPSAVFVILTSLTEDAVNFYNKGVDAIIDSRARSGREFVAKVFCHDANRLSIEALKVDFPAFRINLPECDPILNNFSWKR
jgi:hypothetical protein